MRTNWMKLAVLVIAGMIWMGCEKASDATKSTSDAAKDAADSAKQAGAQVADKAGEMAETLTTEAQKLLDQATEYVKEKKFDLAEPVIAKLEAMKTQLPAEWAAKIEQARSAFDTARKAVQALPAGTPAASPPAAN